MTTTDRQTWIDRLTREAKAIAKAAGQDHPEAILRRKMIAQLQKY